MPTRVV
ncbi:hypothetical protein RDI58_030196 [Solanum bulbocastanum]